MTATSRIDWRVEFEARKTTFVEATWQAMMRDPAQQRRYFYYRRTDGRVWGEFFAVVEGTEPPAGTELVTAEAIPAAAKWEIYRWLGRFVGQLPLIPEGV
jgi:hypothetical protein